MDLDKIITKHVDNVVERLISSITQVQSILGKDFATLEEIAIAVRRFGYDTELTIYYFTEISNAPTGSTETSAETPARTQTEPPVGTPTVAPTRTQTEPPAGIPTVAETPARTAVFKKSPKPCILSEESDDIVIDIVSPETERAIQRVLDEENTERNRIIQLEEKMTMEFLMEESKEKQKELDQCTYECSICLDDLKIDQIYILEECFHRYCRQCLNDHCKTQIQDGNTRQITCPTVDCNHIISYAEIQHVLSSEMLEKYETFLLKATLTDDPDCVWCARPGCDMAMIAHGGIMMVCPLDSCGFAFCRSCQEPWHSDSTCEQYKQWKLDNSDVDARYEEWARRNTKNCPGCGKPIQKNGGCNHMTCGQCGDEFCWICLEEYNGHDNRSCERYS